jgi:hypothetical protein
MSWNVTHKAQRVDLTVDVDRPAILMQTADGTWHQYNLTDREIAALLKRLAAWLHSPHTLPLDLGGAA